MKRTLNDMSEAELAEWQYAHRDNLDSDEGEPVEFEIAPQLSVTMSFRLPGAEADSIRGAARDASMSLSEWIRQACADAVDPDKNRSRRAVENELIKAERQVEAELIKAERQLDAMRKQLEAARRKNRWTVKRARKAATAKQEATGDSPRKPSRKT